MAANKKKATARHAEDTPVKSFLDMIAPSVVQFNPDHFICGNTFRCVWALREYPTQTDEQALLRHLGEKDGIKGVARLLGNDTKQLSDTDFFPIALGIVLGVLFGKLNISFSDSLSFSPGLTGGILMVALFLSAIGKTGPILWSMSGPANQLLRQLGLLLFLAEVGTSAGRNLMATFQESGWLLFGVGAAITLVPMLVAVCVGLFVFKINILDLLGTITGGMTSTPGLAAADSMTDSNIPSVAYATVYPIAMVFLILIIQVIASAVY